MKSKNATKLKSFTKFCELHPDFRFWQALRNYEKANKIYLEKYSKKWDDMLLEDTYYK